MYKFVRIRFKYDNSESWYFVPITVEQIQEHFTKIFGCEIKDGVEDKVQGMFIPSHPKTNWRKAVDLVNLGSGNSWISDALLLENTVLNQRISYFNEGMTLYLSNGVSQLGFSDKLHEIVEDIEKDTLIYPNETNLTLSDVRYSQWNIPGISIGIHWYAKIGSTDIKDSKGNMKWNTKEEAEEAAKWFLNNIIYEK